MPTSCLDCKVSTEVGEMGGSVGLPSLAAEPKGRGRHPLSTKLSTGGGSDTDETFGYIEGGFRAVGLIVHSFERYRTFLEAHTGHRLFAWSFEEEVECLPLDLQEEARGTSEWPCTPYTKPNRSEGYVWAVLLAQCVRCEDSYRSDSADWVRPFETRVLSVDEIKRFCGAARASECNVFEAEPFNMVIQDLGEWLAEHKSHKPSLELERQ